MKYFKNCASKETTIKVRILKIDQLRRTQHLVKICLESQRIGSYLYTSIHVYNKCT